MTLEVLVTLAEPAMVRKVSGKYIATLVHTILKMMANLEDIENWAFIDEVVEEDREINCVVYWKRAGQAGLCGFDDKNYAEERKVCSTTKY